MKKINLLLIALLLTGLAGCGKEEKNNEMNYIQAFQTKLQSAPLTELSENSFPEWLLFKIREVENEPSSMTGVKIFKGKWRNQVVYFVRNLLSSCVFCDIYLENGAKVELLDENDIKDFCITSKDWEKIYEYGVLTN
jgi:hypothetical protein